MKKEGLKLIDFLEEKAKSQNDVSILKNECVKAYDFKVCILRIK